MSFIFRFIYTIIIFFVAPAYLIKLLKPVENKPSIGPRWKELFGFGPQITGKNPLWIHAVSVGEAIGAVSIIKKIHSIEPNLNILVTTTTPTGAKIITNAFSTNVEHRYLPLDFPFPLKRFLSRVNPSACLIMETELWPNLLHCINQREIPIHIVNARLSERSFRRYKKIGMLFRHFMGNVDLVLCQQNQDANRFLSLGIPEHRLKVTGAIKFDLSISDSSLISGLALREQIGKNRDVWIAASTHSGEDEQILTAHKALLSENSSALLIIVPRHPERFKNVGQLIKDQNFNLAIRSKSEVVTDITQVYLADTMGELLTLLAASDVCFMGGSLLGDKVGGHNFLEPAALAKPILTGPSYYNFTEIGKLLIEAGALQVIQSSIELSSNLVTLFSNKDKLTEQGNAGLSVIDANRGAVDKTIQYLPLTSIYGTKHDE